MSAIPAIRPRVSPRRRVSRPVHRTAPRVKSRPTNSAALGDWILAGGAFVILTVLIYAFSALLGHTMLEMGRHDLRSRQALVKSEEREVARLRRGSAGLGSLTSAEDAAAEFGMVRDGLVAEAVTEDEAAN